MFKKRQRPFKPGGRRFSLVIDRFARLAGNIDPLDFCRWRFWIVFLVPFDWASIQVLQYYKVDFNFVTFFCQGAIKETKKKSPLSHSMTSVALHRYTSERFHVVRNSAGEMRPSESPIMAAIEPDDDRPYSVMNSLFSVELIDPSSSSSKSSCNSMIAFQLIQCKWDYQRNFNDLFRLRLRA